MNEGCTNVVPTMPLVSQGSNGYGNGFGDGAWFLWIIVIFALFGFGGFGGGFGGFGGGNRGGYDLGKLATTQDVSSGFALNKIDNQLNGITSGICDSTYAITQAINDIGSNMQQCLNWLIEATINLFTKKVNTVGTYA